MNQTNLLGAALCAFLLLSCASGESSSQENAVRNDGNGNKTSQTTVAADEIMLFKTLFTEKSQMSQDIHVCEDYVFHGNGASFFYVMGDCRYYAFTTVATPRTNYWADIYTGTLSEVECQAIQEELMVGRFENKCRSFVDIDLLCVGCFGSAYISDGHGMVFCEGRGNCQPTGDEARFHDIFSDTAKWSRHMLDNGVPVESDLRGLIIIDRGDEWAHIDYAELPAGLEQYAREASVCQITWYVEGFPGETIIFPQEYQARLKELRSQQQQGLLSPPFSPGIHLKDAAGQKYILYMRPTLPLEDERGLLPMPPNCDEWETIYINQ